MRLYVDAMSIDSITVSPERGGKGGVTVDLESTVKFWLSPEQVSKLCFDLLSFVPADEVAQRIAPDAVTGMASR